MKQKITISIALIASIIFVSLVISDSTVQAQRNRRFSGDTGAITLGPNQILRLTVNAQDGNDTLNVRIKQIYYDTGNCSNNVCRHSIASQMQTEIISLAPGEAASLEGDPDQPFIIGAMRMVIEGNNPMKVNAQIIDTTNGEVQGIIAILIG